LLVGLTVRMMLSLKYHGIYVQPEKQKNRI